MSTHYNGRCALRVLLLFASAVFAAVGSAQTLPQEYSTLIRSDQDVGPLDASLLGERIDYDTGHVESPATTPCRSRWAAVTSRRRTRAA